MWCRLHNAFQVVLRIVQADLPTVRMLTNYYQNAAFLFRAHAEYWGGETVVVISFNVQVKKHKVHVFGDIAWEDGLIIKDLMETIVGSETCNEEFILSQTDIFASQCEQDAALVSSALGDASI